MSLITSVAEAEALQRKRTETEATSNLSGTSFRNVLRDSLGSISEDMDAIFEEAAAKFSLPANLIKAVAKAESDFNPKAVSRAGAMGVMQLMPGTAKSLGVTDPYDARQNIMGGAKYLKENLDCFGDVSLALAAYNAGPNSVRKYGGIPPYSETQNYVKKVTSYLNGTPIYANKTVKTGAGGKTQGSLLAAGNLSGSYSLPRYQGFSGYGNPYGLYGLYGGDSGLSAMSLASGLNVSQDGDTVTMDKESFANLIQMLRLQMMMNAGREVGTILI